MRRLRLRATIVAILSAALVTPASPALAATLPPAGAHLELIHAPLRCVLDGPHPGIIFDWTVTQPYAHSKKQYIDVQVQLQVFAGDIYGGAASWRNYGKTTWKSVLFTKGKTKFPTKTKSAVRFSVSSPDEVAGQRLRGVIRVRWRNQRSKVLPDQTIWQASFTTAAKTCVEGWGTSSTAQLQPSTVKALAAPVAPGLPKELEPAACIPDTSNPGGTDENSFYGELDVDTGWSMFTTSNEAIKGVNWSGMSWTGAELDSFGGLGLSLAPGECGSVGAISAAGTVGLTVTSNFFDPPDVESWAYKPGRAPYLPPSPFSVARTLRDDGVHGDGQRVGKRVAPFVSAACVKKSCLLTGKATLVDIMASSASLSSKTVASSDLRVTLDKGKTRFRWTLSPAMRKAITKRLATGAYVTFSGTVGSQKFSELITLLNH
jgi:hypothetical protein